MAIKQPIKNISELDERRTYRAFIGPTKIGVVYMVEDKKRFFLAMTFQHSMITGQPSHIGERSSAKDTMLQAAQFVLDVYPAEVRNSIFWYEEPSGDPS